MAVLPAGSLPLALPRALAASPAGDLAILDDAGRVHVIGEGRGASFPLPDTRRGSPGGSPCFSPGRDLLVADTHHHRVLRLDPGSGEVLQTIGEYGNGDGQFIYPLGVAARRLEGTPDREEIFVSEYGGDDRIQVFDACGRWLRTFGSRGSAEGQLDRATCLLFDDEGLLWVSDSCNHRIQVMDGDGRVAHVLDGEGTLRYPFAVAPTRDGKGHRIALVIEYGSSRLTALDAEGRVLRRIDRFTLEGRKVSLLGPRGLALDREQELLIADTGNGRVLRVLSPALDLLHGERRPGTP
jgi:DNA-binding beta-propeller fold protein YncE